MLFREVGYLPDGRAADGGVVVSDGCRYGAKGQRRHSCHAVRSLRGDGELIWERSEVLTGGPEGTNLFSVVDHRGRGLLTGPVTRGEALARQLERDLPETCNRHPRSDLHISEPEGCRPNEKPNQ